MNETVPKWQWTPQHVASLTVGLLGVVLDYLTVHVAELPSWVGTAVLSINGVVALLISSPKDAAVVADAKADAVADAKALTPKDGTK